jgi:hypothetical protein
MRLHERGVGLDEAQEPEVREVEVDVADRVEPHRAVVRAAGHAGVGQDAQREPRAGVEWAAHAVVHAVRPVVDAVDA